MKFDCEEIFQTTFDEEVELKSPFMGIYDARRIAMKNALIEVLNESRWHTHDWEDRTERLKFVLLKIIEEMK